MLPTSPYNFMQEKYRHDKWQMLIICMMLNQTSFKQVNLVREEFFNKFPDAESLVSVTDEEVIQVIKPLGFYNKRCKMWKKFSQQWLENKWQNVKELAGIGKYASDSWQIFQEYNYNIVVEDKELKKYLQWVKRTYPEKIV